jgi:glycosyltransferase involved in cell wall biosynthesis
MDERKPVVAILNGLMNPIPPVKGGGPQIVIYNTCLELSDCSFEWFVLSNWDPQLERIDYPRDQFISVKTCFLDRVLATLINLFPHRIVKGVFGVVRKDHLTLNIKLIRSLLFHRFDMILVHESYALTYLCHLVFPHKKIILYYHSCKMHLDLTEKRWVRLVKAANAGIISICKKVFELTDGAFTVNPHQKWVIINGVRSSGVVLGNPDEKDRLRQKLGVAMDEFVFLYVGRIFPMKGLDLLVDAFAEVIQRTDVPVKLIIVGSAETDEEGNIEYEKKLKENALKLAQDRIIFIGFIPNDQLSDYYLASDCGVLPTYLLEGNSLFLMECLTNGLPVIATMKGGIPEVVRNGIDGILIDEDELSKDLSPTMLNVIKNREIWAGKKLEIAESARERFSYQRVANDLGAVIEEVFSSRTPFRN